MSAALRAVGLLGLATAAAISCSRDVPTTPAHGGLAAGPSSSADRSPDLSSGVLSLCKQAGAGLATGQLFTFRVTLSDVTRSLAVAAGSCVQLEVPRASAPLSKGYYKANPDAVARLLPAGATLDVDAAVLSADQVEAILTGSNVTAASSLLLNFAQQLIAADLNLLRGVQPSAQVLQAIIDGNAAIHITAAGTTLEITTSLTTSQLSALVNSLSGFNEGKTKPLATPSSASLQIVETVGSLTEVTAIVCDQSVRCSSVNTGTGSVTASVVSGQTTTVTYTNKARPVLSVCKVAGPGIEAGTVFHITATALGLNSGITAFDVPAGECRDAALAPGSYLLQESISAGSAVSAIACDPAARCGTPVVHDGVVGAVVVDASTTTVTYTNRSTLGTLNVCKVAGAGIDAGTVFRISATALGLNSGTTNFDVPAGDCRSASVTEGSYLMQEVIASGTAVSAISCDPTTKCATPVLADGVVGISVSALATTTVTYTNRSTLGTLRVCKVAGPGITAGTVFRITATALGLLSGTTNFDVPAGDCREAALTQGSYILQEALSTGIAVSAIGCDAPSGCGTPNLAAGVVTTAVTAQSTTTITYTNRSTLGTLTVCKVAGPGVAAGTVFRISATVLGLLSGTTNFDVPAGECRAASLPQGSYILQETIGPGIVVSGITCDVVAHCGTPNLAAGVVTAAITAQTTSTVTYTNSALSSSLEPFGTDGKRWKADRGGGSLKAASGIIGRVEQ